jgi:hypothetical protein
MYMAGAMAHRCLIQPVSIDLVCGTQGMDAGGERVHDGGAT